MPVALVETKFFRPRARAGLVPGPASTSSWAPGGPG